MCSLGGAAFPFVLGSLLDKFGKSDLHSPKRSSSPPDCVLGYPRKGFTWTIRIWALICAVAFGAAIYFIRPRIPPARFAKGQPRPKWFLVNLKSLNHPLNYTMASPREPSCKSCRTAD